MSEQDEAEQARESELYGQKLDPIARKILTAEDPWDAYRIAGEAPGQLLHELEWLPHGGAVYICWAELADVFETGKTPIPDAYAALRRAASAWLDRSGLQGADDIEQWIELAGAEVGVLLRRDGDLWGGP